MIREADFQPVHEDNLIRRNDLRRFQEEPFQEIIL
jgi:hypothetical protein